MEKIIKDFISKSLRELLKEIWLSILFLISISIIKIINYGIIAKLLENGRLWILLAIVIFVLIIRIFLYLKRVFEIKKVFSSKDKFGTQLSIELNNEENKHFQLVSYRGKTIVNYIEFYILKSFIIFADFNKVELIIIHKDCVNKIKISRYKNIASRGTFQHWWLEIDYLDIDLEKKNLNINFEANYFENYDLIEILRKIAKVKEIGKISLEQAKEDIHYLEEILDQDFEEEYIRKFHLDKK